MPKNHQAAFSDLLRKVPGFNFLQDSFSTDRELDAERFAPELRIEKQFLDAVCNLKSLPQVQSLIESSRESQDTGLPVLGLSKQVTPIVGHVQALANKHLSKFRPEILKEIRRDRSDGLLPTKIQDFLRRVEYSADLLQRGKMGVPMFLRALGVPMSVYHAASATSDEDKLAQRVAAKKVAYSEESENPYNGLRRDQVLKILNNFLRPWNQGLYRDSYWAPVQSILKVLAERKVVLVPRENRNTGYTVRGGVPVRKTWVYEVFFLDNRGAQDSVLIQIEANGSGPEDDPLSVYSISGSAS